MIAPLRRSSQAKLVQHINVPIQIPDTKLKDLCEISFGAHHGKGKSYTPPFEMPDASDEPCTDGCTPL